MPPRRFPLLIVCSTLLIGACVEAQDDAPSATEIVEQAITAHGGAVLQRAKVSFDFRDYHFVVTRDGGMFSYERTYVEDGDSLREVLTNHGVTREINGEEVVLTEDEERRLLTPLNSVPYFALLPLNLRDPAVQTRNLGETTIHGEPYYEIEVTFQEEGGGRDYQDRYVYWFHKRDHTMDFLAYTFHNGDEGTRFREAYNVRTINGVLFADYHNYTADALASPDSPIETFDDLFQSGQVNLLSEIDLENIFVEPLDR